MSYNINPVAPYLPCNCAAHSVPTDMLGNPLDWTLLTRGGVAAIASSVLSLSQPIGSKDSSADGLHAEFAESTMDWQSQFDLSFSSDDAWIGNFLRMYAEWKAPPGAGPYALIQITPNNVITLKSGIGADVPFNLTQTTDVGVILKYINGICYFWVRDGVAPYVYVGAASMASNTYGPVREFRFSCGTEGGHVTTSAITSTVRNATIEALQ